MPDDPLLIFDGRCGFCRIWIEYWKIITRGRIAYAPSQEVGNSYPQITPEEFGQSVQLVMPSGEVMRGARAVFETLTYAPGMAWLLWAYEHVPGFAPVTEAAYRWIAAHRNLTYQLTRFTFGLRIRPLQTAKVEWLFLRALAAIYLAAFASLAVQITGLIGERGILPVSRYLAAVSRISRRILGGAHHLLDRAWRPGFRSSVLDRRRDCPCTVFGITNRLSGAHRAGLFVRSLSFVLHRGPGFSVVPVGRAAARSRVSRDLPGQFENRRVLLFRWLLVPRHVSLGRGEADEPRSDMARSVGNCVSLPDAASAYADRLVHVSTAALVPALFDVIAVIHRAGDAVPVLCAPPLAILGRRTGCCCFNR